MKVKINILLYLLCLVVWSCDYKVKQTIIGKRIITDETGRKIYLDLSIDSIISLCPSSTEILCSILADSSKLRAVSVHCNFPEFVNKKKKIQVYPLDIEQVLVMQPDLVITKADMISAENILFLEKSNIPLYLQKADRINDIEQSIFRLDTLLNGRRNDNRMQYQQNNTTPIQDQTALVMASLQQLYVYGNDSYMSDILQQSGYRNAVDKKITQPFPLLDEEKIYMMNPDVIVLSDTAGVPQFLKKHPLISKVNAIKNNKIIYVHSDLLSRPGPRYREVIRILKESKN